MTRPLSLFAAGNQEQWLTMRLRSSAFPDGHRIPTRYTCDGANLSPPLAWEDVPQGTRSFTILCDDPDAPKGTWHHWAVFDIPADQSTLVEGVRPAEQAGLGQARNDFGKLGYGGPCPPRGHGPHRYRFRILALAVARLPLPKGPSFGDVERAAREHVVEEASLVGIYQRT
jgi:Raf kinase inhibitor-like YbhB/YbcL family protein